MKRIITGIVMMFVLGATSFAQNDGEARAIAAARAAISNDCLAGHSIVKTSVSENYNCNIYDGVGINRTVYFYTAPNCPPGQICPLYIMPLATVVVDCDYTVVDIKCYGPVLY